MGKRVSATCKNCGGKIEVNPNQGNNSDNNFEFQPEHQLSDNLKDTPEVTEKDFIDFIGPNVDKYIENFRKFNVAGVEQFSLTWHWPAFFVSFFWMLYRKLYLWALLTFFLSYIPGVSFILMIAYGLTGNYLYFKHAKKKIIELKTQQSPSYLSENLRQIGGVNQWVKTLVIILSIIVILGTIAAILILLFVFKDHKLFTF